ncbi:hypothetical protein LINPERPRIM_LOCUS1239 [Linum perenne]
MMTVSVGKMAGITLMLVLHVLAADIPSSSALVPYGYKEILLQISEWDGSKKTGDEREHYIEGKQVLSRRSLRTSSGTRAPPPPVVNRTKSFTMVSPPPPNAR